MTPQEVANKFASASATCQNGKCPFTANCRGTTDTCKMKEVAMLIRSMLAEIATLQAKYNLMSALADKSVEYMSDLEKINDRYYHLCLSFQNGYKPKPKIKRKSPPKQRKGKKITPAEMDGNEKYAQEEPRKTPEELPVVII